MLRSFIPVTSESHFPIQNLPYGIFSDSENTNPRVGVAIGEYVLDLSVLEQADLLKTKNIFNQSTLNAFMSLGRDTWHETRVALQHLLAADTATLRDDSALRQRGASNRAAPRSALPVSETGEAQSARGCHHRANRGNTSGGNRAFDMAVLQ